MQVQVVGRAGHRLLSMWRFTLFAAATFVGVARGEDGQASCIFEGSRLFNRTGHTATCADLGGKSVGLYFAGEWCPLCQRFTPSLRRFYEHWKDHVSLVFISSDGSKEEAHQHYKHQSRPSDVAPTGEHGWLALAWDDPLSASLKQKYRVWSGREVGQFGYRRRSGVPCVVVIAPNGDELSFLAGERFGAAALREWEPDEKASWPHTQDKGEL